MREIQQVFKHWLQLLKSWLQSFKRQLKVTLVVPTFAYRHRYQGFFWTGKRSWLMCSWICHFTQPHFSSKLLKFKLRLITRPRFVIRKIFDIRPIFGANSRLISYKALIFASTTNLKSVPRFAEICSNLIWIFHFLRSEFPSDGPEGKPRSCQRKCASDSDCLNDRKLCLCDGQCGMSCIRYLSFYLGDIDTESMYVQYVQIIQLNVYAHATFKEI